VRLIDRVSFFFLEQAHIHDKYKIERVNRKLFFLLYTIKDRFLFAQNVNVTLPKIEITLVLSKLSTTKRDLIDLFAFRYHPLLSTTPQFFNCHNNPSVTSHVTGTKGTSSNRPSKVNNTFLCCVLPETSLIASAERLCQKLEGTLSLPIMTLSPLAQQQ